MKIAMTYENGKVFQHFGHTSEFIVYTVEEGKVADQMILSSNGQGHGALATLLSANDIDVLICGGIGPGAINALMANNIQVFNGASGDCDTVIQMYLNGELSFDEDKKCDHHEHEHGHDCGDHECHCH